MLIKGEWLHRMHKIFHLEVVLETWYFSTEGVIEIVRRVRIEQSALPLCFNFLLRHPEEIAELQIIYADDQVNIIHYFQYRVNS